MYLSVSLCIWTPMEVVTFKRMHTFPQNVPSRLEHLPPFHERIRDMPSITQEVWIYRDSIQMLQTNFQFMPLISPPKS